MKVYEIYCYHCDEKRWQKIIKVDRINKFYTIIGFRCSVCGEYFEVVCNTVQYDRIIKNSVEYEPEEVL